MQEDQNLPVLTRENPIITSGEQLSNLSPDPTAQSEVQPMIISTITTEMPYTKSRLSRKILLLVCVFLLSICAGFVGYKLLNRTESDSYATYSGKGKFSFEYPKNWILKEEDTTSQDYGGYKVMVSTPDYTSQEGESKFTEITTKGYRFTVYHSKNDGIFEDTNAFYDYLSSEGAAGLKKLESTNGTVVVQDVGQPSALIDYSHNSNTQSFYIRDGHNYSLIYDYPDRKDFIPDEAYIEQYNHFINTFVEKK